jgi:hypothetical protein
MKVALLTMIMTMRLAWVVVAYRTVMVSVSDRLLAVQLATAAWYSWRLASPKARSRARFYGEIFGLTGVHLTRWPYRYMPEFVAGEEALSPQP